MKRELTLNKKTVANLDHVNMTKVKGGKSFTCFETYVGCHCTGTSNRTDI